MRHAATRLALMVTLAAGCASSANAGHPLVGTWRSDEFDDPHPTPDSVARRVDEFTFRADGGVELFFAAHRDGVVPALAVGLGGVWAEALDDVAVIPLPVAPARVEQALRSLRAAPLLLGARGTTPPNLTAAAQFGAAIGDLLLDQRLALLEVNPALATPTACIALDCIAR